MKNWIRTHQLTLFVVMTFLASWVCWLAVFNDLKPSLFEFEGRTLLIFLLGAYTPSMVALALGYCLGGAEGVKSLLHRLMMWRVGMFWNLLALLAGPAIYALAVWLYAASGGVLGAVNYGLLPWIPVIFLVSLFLGPLAEELGWRGFLLPRLNPQARPIRAAVIVGLIWGAWHIPLFWAVIGTSVSGFPVSLSSVTLFFLSTIGASFLYVWMHNKTGGSLWIAVLIHLGWNTSGTTVSLLFPEMSAAQKLDFYLYPIALVWGVLGLVALVNFAKSPKALIHIVYQKMRLLNSLFNEHNIRALRHKDA
jgi:membrane protease YdiL (CAAX protease family)